MAVNKISANFGFDFDFDKDIEVDSYTGEILDKSPEEKAAPRKGGKVGRYCGVQEHIKDAPTQAVDAMIICWELGYYGLAGLEPMLLLGELKDVAECAYEFLEGPKKGDGPTWKTRKLPKKEWLVDEMPTPEEFEERCSEIMTELRLLSLKRPSKPKRAAK